MRALQLPLGHEGHQLGPNAPLPRTPTVPAVSFRPLTEPEPSFPIQVDTPQPQVQSSPRQVVDPTTLYLVHPIVEAQYQMMATPFVGMPDFESSILGRSYSPCNSAGSSYFRPASNHVYGVPVVPYFYEARPDSFRPFSANQRPSSSFVEHTMLPPIQPRDVSTKKTPKKTPKKASKKHSDRPYRIPEPSVTPRKPQPVRTPQSKVRLQPSPTPARKSRGCWTCKCRRKRCDEQQPACNMCLKLNLPCYGFSLERPECMESPAKTESTRHQLAELTKNSRFINRTPLGAGMGLAESFKPQYTPQAKIEGSENFPPTNEPRL